jgi:ABC-type uncharacterized transport system substrate-binding protein
VAVIQTEGSLWRGDFDVIASANRSFATEVIKTTVHDATDIERAITALGAEPNVGLVLPPDVITTQHRELILGLAAKYRLPAVYSSRTFISGGGLMYYGADPDDIFRRAAVYVDCILKSEKPGELPVQAPTKFELIINLNTAKALGLTVPPSLLARADEVIE